MRKAFLTIAASLALAATAWVDLSPFHGIGSSLSDCADYCPYQRSSAIHGMMGKIDYGVVDVYTWSTKYGNPVNTAIVSETMTIWVLRHDHGGAAGFTPGRNGNQSPAFTG